MTFPEIGVGGTPLYDVPTERLRVEVINKQ